MSPSYIVIFCYPSSFSYSSYRQKPYQCYYSRVLRYPTLTAHLPPLRLRLLKNAAMFLSRIFGKKSYETEVVDGVEIGRPIVDAAHVPGQSFSSSSSSNGGSSPRSSLGRRETFPVLPQNNTPSRGRIRRRPAPLQPGFLNFRNPADPNGGGTVWSPVRRSGAVRRTTNPLTRRRQTISSWEDDDLNPPAGQSAPRSAVSRSNTLQYQGNRLTSYQQSEPPTLYAEPESEPVNVDLSSFVPPPQWNNGRLTPVRRGALRTAENPLTVRRDALQGNYDNTCSSGLPRNRRPSVSGHPPPSYGGTLPVRRNALRHTENPLIVRQNSLQGDNTTGNQSRLPRQRQPSTSGLGIDASNNHGPGDLSRDEIESLPRLLKSWIDTGMTACDIGRYAVQTLDRRDRFLNNFVTLLVDAHTPYTNIGRAILNRFDIRDEYGRPLHDRLPPGVTSLQASRHHNAQSSPPRIRSLTQSSHAPLTTEHADFVNPSVVCPQPRQHMPVSFIRDLNMRWFTESRSSDEETDPVLYSPRTSDDYPILRNGAERRVQIVHPGSLPSSEHGSIHSGSEPSSARPDFSPGRPHHQHYGQSHGQSYAQASHRQQAYDRLQGWDGARGRGPFL